MSQGKVQAQIPWSDDVAVLQNSLYTLLAPILTADHTPLILSQSALLEYWAPAFTHKSVAPRPNNYEDFEFEGDLRLGPQFNKYLVKYFGTRLSPAQGTYFQNTYMSKEYQAELSRKIGLNRLVRYDPNVENANTDIEEDVFESFAGALGAVVDAKVQDGLGDIYVFNLLTQIFQTIPLSLDEVARDSVSLLKELFDKKRWGKVEYHLERSDRQDMGPSKATVRDPQGGILGVGYGKQSMAESQAASNALEKLRSEGITRETADQELLESKRKQSPAFDEQYRRVQTAIVKLNQQSATRGTVQITDFKLTSSGNTKQGSNTVYTFTLDLAYPLPDGRIQWRSTVTESGLDQNAVRIALMRKFADSMKV